MKVILGSGSPRRKELLSEIVDSFEIIPSNFDESKIKNIEKDPTKLVETLSKLKGEEVYSRIKNEKEFILISSDTMVFCDKKLLGKPKNEKEAFEMLTLIQNNVHTVYTGLYMAIKKRREGKKNSNIIQFRCIF